MRSFKQFISEIFNKSKSTGTSSIDYHPDLRGEIKSHGATYSHETKNGKKIKTHFEFAGKNLPHKLPSDFPIDVDRDNVWETDFTVDGMWDRGESGDQFPSDVTAKVFDHFQHFINNAKYYIGTPHFVYDTANSKKHRIYQAAAKRLGVTATNMNRIPASSPIWRQNSAAVNS